MFGDRNRRTPWLPLWGSWLPRKGQTERAAWFDFGCYYLTAVPSQSACSADSSPKGRAKGRCRICPQITIFRFIPRAPHWRGKWSDVFLPPLNGYFADTAPDRKPPVRRGPPPHPPGPQAEADAEADAEAEAEADADAEAEADAEGDKEREGEGILARLSPGRTRFLGNTAQWVLP